jgi:hypothetical protein
LHACVHRDECACVMSVSDVLCNSQKKVRHIIDDDMFTICGFDSEDVAHAVADTRMLVVS